MITKPLSHWCLGLVSLTIAGLIAGCHTSAPTATNPSPPVSGDAAAVESTSLEEAFATINEIQKQPVWVQRLNTKDEVPAQENMDLQVGETIRTEKEALVQVELKNGLSFRIGGNSVLTLQPDNRLKLKAGEMITWVEPGKKVPVEIETPVAIAGIRGTTIYINMPEDPKKEIEFFAWEGSVEVWFPNQPGKCQFKAGEQVKIKPGQTDINQVRQQVRQLPPREWLKRRRQSKLLNKFDKPLPTLQKIDDTAPSES
ncbi:MAG: FecR domain-containing protein [Symploca sp. SIO2C1]|nr:FecR domain-containing protein [Symploca sp. SIO2C1]